MSVDGGAPQPLAAGLPVNGASHTVVITGHFSQPVPENLCLLLYLRNLSATLTVDGQTLLVHQPGDALPVFLPSGGAVWRTVVSPGITAESEVTLTLRGVYPTSGGSLYTEALEHLYVGSEGGLYRQMIRQRGPSLLLASFVISLGLLLLAFSLVYRVWRLPHLQCVLFSACFAVLGGVWYLSDAVGRYPSLLLPNASFCVTLAYLCLYLMPVVAGLYARAMLHSPIRRVVSVSLAVSVVFAIVAAVLQLTGACDLYPLQSVALLVVLLCSGADFACLLYELLRYRRSERSALYVTLSFLPAVLCGVVDALLFVLGKTGEFTLFGYGLPISVLLQLVYLLRYVQDSAKAILRARDLENQLKQSRISTMLSQIKPHFLYNVLNAISGLCVTDPSRADEAIMLFSSYLRANLNSIDNDALVRFSRELEHVKSYVNLEQMRYGDRLRVHYNIQYTDFDLPTLALQPLVENAIRHGIAEKPEGGTATVETQRVSGGVCVTVTDDGVGFDPKADARPESVGLRNIRQRLQYLCGAELRIQSAPGHGTTATIFFPDGKEANA